MNVTEFTARLYFKNTPKYSTQALIESWEKEGYTCELSEEFNPNNELFRGLRGATYVILERPEPIKSSEIPDNYPEVTKVNINYDETHLVNPKRAFADFQESHYQIELLFRIVEDDDEPKISHNEWAAVLLGIYQEHPINSAWFHETGILIGKEDLEEFTSYANTQNGKICQFSPSLAFGVFITQNDDVIKAWSTGLNHFNHKNIFIESKNITPFDAIRVVFNVGYMITGKNQFKENETIEIQDIFCKILSAKLFDEDALKFTPIQ